MALIKCPECGKEISDKAKACPNCGFCVECENELKVTQKNINEEMLNKEKSHFIIVAVIGIIVLAIVGFGAYWYATAFDRAVGKAQESHQEYQNTMDELEDLQDQLE